MRTCAVAVLLVLVVGGCADSEEPSSIDAIDTTVSTVASLPSSTTVVQMTTVTRPSVDWTGFVIRADGLGVVSLGDPMDDVVTTLTEALGDPSSDIVMQAPFDSGYEGNDRGPMACNTATGYACFEYLRWMSWNAAGLGVTFLDSTEDPGAEVGSDDYFLQVPPNLQGYDYWGGYADGLIYTSHGITIGSTVEDLQALGDIVRFFGDACGGQIAFGITDPAAGNGFIWGWLDAPSREWEAFEESGVLSPEAFVDSLAAGARSSC